MQGSNFTWLSSTLPEVESRQNWTLPRKPSVVRSKAYANGSDVQIKKFVNVCVWCTCCHRIDIEANVNVRPFPNRQSYDMCLPYVAATARAPDGRLASQVHVKVQSTAVDIPTSVIRKLNGLRPHEQVSVRTVDLDLWVCGSYQQSSRVSQGTHRSANQLTHKLKAFVGLRNRQSCVDQHTVYAHVPLAFRSSTFAKAKLSDHNRLKFWTFPPVSGAKRHGTSCEWNRPQYETLKWLHACLGTWIRYRIFKCLHKLVIFYHTECSENGLIATRAN